MIKSILDENEAVARIFFDEAIDCNKKLFCDLHPISLYIDACIDRQ